MPQQTQSGAASGVPSIPTPETTAVLVIETAKRGVTAQQIMAIIPKEIRATVKLYLDGKSNSGIRAETAKPSSSWSTQRPRTRHEPSWKPCLWQRKSCSITSTFPSDR
jgi:hypothetical protein